MKRQRANLDTHEEWISSDFLRTDFDKQKLILATKESPRWLHIGANNTCLLPALVLQNLIEHNEAFCGLILAECSHYSVFEKQFNPNKDNGIVLKKEQESYKEKKIIATIVETLKADLCLFPADWKRLVQIFRNQSLQIVSFSLGVKMYDFCTPGGRLLSCYEKDCENGPDNVQTDLGKITALCLERFLAGEYPLSLVSFDDCQKNGSRLNEVIVRISREWEERGSVVKGFSSWLNEPEIISFPWTSISNKADKKSPVLHSTEHEDDETLKQLQKNKSPLFILHEDSSVFIEDDFPNGRLPLEKSGVVLTSRDVISSLE